AGVLRRYRGGAEPLRRIALNPSVAVAPPDADGAQPASGIDQPAPQIEAAAPRRIAVEPVRRVCGPVGGKPGRDRAGGSGQEMIGRRAKRVVALLAVYDRTPQVDDV